MAAEPTGAAGLAPRPTILILGGTGEARALAAALHDPDGGGADAASPVRVVSSLAGRVARPRLPVGETRIGGFGGPERLAEWIAQEGVACVVDATHPFAERISASAARAAAIAGTPILRLQRPGWEARPGDDWHRVASLAQAAALLPRFAPVAASSEPSPRVLLTSGRQGLAAFRDCSEAWFLIRCVDPPEPADLPPHHRLLLDRGPYTLEGELALIDEGRIDVIVTKDSGGALTVAKLDAARERGLPVVVISRPAGPAIATVAGVDAAASWAREHLTS